MTSIELDDSFDSELASLDIPDVAPPKVARIENKTTQNSSTSTTVTTVVTATATAAPKIDQPSASNAPATSKAKNANPHNILVHPKQRGNPILKSITNVPIEFCDDITPDYIVGRTTCILYLSLKYHNLNPDYILQRLKNLGKQFELRVLLVQVDTPEPHNALKSLTRMTLLTDLTLMLAWNAEEAGKMIETYKLFENKPPDLIMERVESNPHQKLVAALTSIKPVNKTDAFSLLQNFGNLENIVNASEERLSQVLGLGPRKAKMLHKTLQEPFIAKN